MSAYPVGVRRAETRVEGILFPTLAEVIAESDLFIVGGVLAVSPGRAAGLTVAELLEEVRRLAD